MPKQIAPNVHAAVLMYLARGSTLWFPTAAIVSERYDIRAQECDNKSCKKPRLGFFNSVDGLACQSCKHPWKTDTVEVARNRRGGRSTGYELALCDLSQLELLFKELSEEEERVLFPYEALDIYSIQHAAAAVGMSVEKAWALYNARDGIGRTWQEDVERHALLPMPWLDEPRYEDKVLGFLRSRWFAEELPWTYRRMRNALDSGRAKVSERLIRTQFPWAIVMGVTRQGG